jgi:hypothetical protein
LAPPHIRARATPNEPPIAEPCRASSCPIARAGTEEIDRASPTAQAVAQRWNRPDEPSPIDATYPRAVARRRYPGHFGAMSYGPAQEPTRARTAPVTSVGEQCQPARETLPTHHSRPGRSLAGREWWVRSAKRPRNTPHSPRPARQLAAPNPRRATRQPSSRSRVVGETCKMAAKHPSRTTRDSPVGVAGITSGRAYRLPRSASPPGA